MSNCALSHQLRYIFCKKFPVLTAFFFFQRTWSFSPTMIMTHGLVKNKHDVIFQKLDGLSTITQSKLHQIRVLLHKESKWLSSMQSHERLPALLMDGQHLFLSLFKKFMQSWILEHFQKVVMSLNAVAPKRTLDLKNVRG